MENALKTLSDEDLVKVFKEGNRKAFDELYERYAARLKRLIYYYLGNAEESSDVLHDVFLRVFMHINSFKTEMSFSSWIYKIAVNCSKNFKRKYRYEVILGENEQSIAEGVSGEDSPEEQFLKKEDMKALYDAVGSLKDKFREVFLLRFDQGLPYSQISAILNCPERTAKWRMQKAIEKIVDRLKDEKIV
jgi:RNA polymerase sigma-70 factor, ECF subfamily